jgi:hypothetical protein
MVALTRSAPRNLCMEQPHTHTDTHIYIYIQ